MVSDVEPMVFPSRDVGGEFVGKIFVTSFLPKLNAGAPYNGCILEVGCSFTRKRCRKRSQWGSITRKASQKWMKIAKWQIEFWVEMMELKTVEIKKATEEGTGGEG
jgi:hypothetical protein